MFSPDGKKIVTGSRTIFVWHTNNGQLAATAFEQSDTAWGATISPDGAQIAFGSNGKAIYVINASTGINLLKVMAAPPILLLSLLMGRGLANNTLSIWDVVSAGNRLVRPFRGHSAFVQ